MLYQKRFTREGENRLEEYCAMLPALERTSLSHGMRPTPDLGGMDISSAFILRERWMHERASFGKGGANMLCNAKRRA
jgi:hypothetical protein